MASIFAVNENNDIYATPTNRLALKIDIDAVLQLCKHVVETRLGEVFFDRTIGIDYLGLVFTGSANLPAFEADIRSQVTQLDGVRSIVDFTYTVRGGVVDYIMTVSTIYGEGVVNGNV